MGILGFLISKKYNPKWYIMLSGWVIIPIISFVFGTIDYRNGDARLMGIGGPSTYHGIDMETRVPIVSSGCIVMGTESFTQKPNNWAVKLWTNIFGYQKGAYAGIFPNREESFKYLSKGDTIKVKSQNGKILFDLRNTNYKIDSIDFYGYRYGNRLDSVVVEVVDEECLIFEQLNNDGNKYGNYVYLAALDNEKILRKYYKE